MSISMPASIMNQVEAFYERHPEPLRGCLLALHQIILAQHPDMQMEWKYSMPFFTFRGKMFCYIWHHKKFKQPYIGIVEGWRLKHPDLLEEKRSRIKIFLVDANADLDIERIEEILGFALNLYLDGTVPTKKNQ